MCLQFDNISQNVRLGDDLKVNLRFESFVNLIRYKTICLIRAKGFMFESFVNLIRYKTKITIASISMGLRALLI